MSNWLVLIMTFHINDALLWSHYKGSNWKCNLSLFSLQHKLIINSLTLCLSRIGNYFFRSHAKSDQNVGPCTIIFNFWNTETSLTHLISSCLSKFPPFCHPTLLVWEPCNSQITELWHNVIQFHMRYANRLTHHMTVILIAQKVAIL